MDKVEWDINELLENGLQAPAGYDGTEPQPAETKPEEVKAETPPPESTETAPQEPPEEEEKADEAPSSQKVKFAGREFASLEEAERSYKEMQSYSTRAAEEARRDEARKVEDRIRQLEARITDGQRVRDENRYKEQFDKDISEDPYRGVRKVSELAAQEIVQRTVDPIANEIRALRMQQVAADYDAEFNRVVSTIPKEEWEQLQPKAMERGKEFITTVVDAATQGALFAGLPANVAEQVAAAVAQRINFDKRFIPAFVDMARGSTVAETKTKAAAKAAAKAAETEQKKVKAAAAAASPSSQQPAATDDEVDTSKMSLDEYKAHLKKNGNWGAFGV